MLSLLGIGLLSAAISQTSPPDISGEWSNDGWGRVVLTRNAAGEYSGTFSQTEGSELGKIRLNWRLIHFTLPPRAVSKPVAHRSVEEIWYVLGGRGRIC